MLKAEFAELILSMTLPAGAAASIAGDLEEEAARRGYLWFWITLVRTAASASWRVFAQAPLGMAGWALAGLAGWFLSSMAIGAIVSALFDRALPESERRDINFILVTVAVAFRFGQWLARNVPYRELPVYAMTSIVWHLGIWLVTTWILPLAYGYHSWIVGAVASAIGPIFTLAGIKRGRTLAHKR
jgi:hypothetical protein